MGPTKWIGLTEPSAHWGESPCPARPGPKLGEGGPSLVVVRVAYSGLSLLGKGVWSEAVGRIRTFHRVYAIDPVTSDLQMGYYTLLHALLSIRGRYGKGELEVRVKFPERSLPNHLRGLWRVRDPEVRRLWESVKALEEQFAGVEYLWDPNDTAPERNLLSEMKRGKRFFLTSQMVAIMEERLPTLLKAMEGLSQEQSFFLTRLLSFVLNPGDLEVSREELVRGKRILATVLRRSGGGEAREGKTEDARMYL